MIQIQTNFQVNINVVKVRGDHEKTIEKDGIYKAETEISECK
jgi:hypothetical protein